MSSNTKKLSLKEPNAACSKLKNKELKRTEERMERKIIENGQARMINLFIDRQSRGLTWPVRDERGMG